MPEYFVTSPTGQKFRITAPEGASQEQVLAYAQQNFAPKKGLKETNLAEYDSAAPEFKAKYGTERGWPVELARQAGLAGRYAIEGGTALAQLPASGLAALMDRGLEAAGSDFRFGNQSQALSNVLTQAGLPIPETREEEIVGNLSRSVAGAGTGIGAGNLLAQAPVQVASAVGRQLAARPLLQGASAVSGAGAAEVAKDRGIGHYGQLTASLAGSIAPSAAIAGQASLARALFRGGEAGRQRLQENLGSFAGAGTIPTVGQATQRRSMQATESLLARAPGGAGPIVSKAEQQADELAANIERKASQLVRKTSAEQAGRQIQRSVSGEGGFIERFRTQQEALYGKIDQLIAPTTRVAVPNTQRALAELSTPISGATQTTRGLINPKIASIAEGLKLDAQDGKLPYEALRQLRTRIGQEMSGAPLAGDVPSAQWKRLYGALSEDLGEAAKQAGPAAREAWLRANTYTRAGMQRIQAIESVIERNGGPEAVFRAATSGTKEGATTLRAVMQSLDGEGKKMVTATVMRRLGLAKAGVQGELGDKFSTESFLTNWNLLSPEAKRTLFDRFGPTFRGDMDQIAKVAANLRTGSKVFVNPSGTAQAATQAATVGALAFSVLTGQLGTASTLAGGIVGANLLSRLMVNPNFVRWLAESTHMPEAGYNAMVNSLLQRAREKDDQDLAAAHLLLSEESRQAPQ